jgi:hypothetical protein
MPELKMLRLSQSMHPNTIVFRILMAQRDYCVNGLSCKGLNLRIGARDNESLTIPQHPPGQDAMDSSAVSSSSSSTSNPCAKHLRDLLYSREWLRVEFEQCQGVESLLVVDVSNTEYRLDNCTDGSSTPSGARSTNPTTSVDFLSIRCLSPFPDPCDSYSTARTLGQSFFGNVWKRWKVQKCRLSVVFTEEWLRDFTAPESYSSLTELDLSGSTFRCHIEDTPMLPDDTHESSRIRIPPSWDQFCRALVYNHPQLKVLHINKCNLADYLLAFFITTTVAHHPTLTELTVKGSHCQQQSLLSLSRVLASPSSQIVSTTPSSSLSGRLTVLSLTNQVLTEDVVPGLAEFCRSLRFATFLTFLSLGDYMLHEPEMRALVHSLGKMPFLTSLSLMTCGMTSQSIQHFCREGLQLNTIPSLRALSIPEDAKDAISTALVFNTSLERLLMEGRSEKHTFYLDLNRGGRRLLQQKPKTTTDAPASAVPISLWPLVLDRAMHPRAEKFYYGGQQRHVDVLFCLLRNKILLEL